MSRHGIRCNALLPGFIESPLNDRIVSQEERVEVSQSPRLSPSSDKKIIFLIVFEESSTWKNWTAIRYILARVNLKCAY